ncbi:kinase-like domain-containing protein [Suillus tomentosus]|nr:kinase-like domain-containing protein [Suillus tomentosus]
MASTSIEPSITLKGHEYSIESISYFPHGQRIISGSADRTTRQWDLKAGKEIEEMRDVCEEVILAVAVSRDGRWVVTGGGEFRSAELKASEVGTGIVKRFEGHSSWINCIDISMDSKLLASGSDDQTARIWSLETGKFVAGPFDSVDSVGAVRFSTDSKKLAIMSSVGTYIEVWDVQSQKLDVGLDGPDFDVESAEFTSAPMFWTKNNKNILAAFSSTGDCGGTIYEFDASTLETVGTPFEGHTMLIVGLELSFDHTLLASASFDNTIKLWAFESRQLLASFDVQDLFRLVLSPDSRQLAYTTDHCKICICDIPPDVLAQASSACSDLPPPPISLAHHRAEFESWTDRHAGTFRIQPTNIRPVADTHSSSATIWGQHYEEGFQPLHPDTPHFNAGPAAGLQNTTLSPVIALPPSSQIPFPMVASQLPQLRPDRREFLPSSSNIHTVFSARNVEPDDFSLEAMLQDLSKYITKEGDYPVTRGGFGEIWKSTLHIDRSSVKVAVKALQVYADDQLQAAKRKKIKRIMRELRICANLNHANILRIYGYTYGFGPFPAIVSPWAENGNLTIYLEREGAALTLVRRFQLLRDIIAGLQYLHANSVIHGDFNGPNVLIRGDGTACVADFGLSLMYSEVVSASQASWTSTLKGNMRWMAPELLVEQEDGSQARPTEQSDMYSFGGIMLQVLTNKIPYHHLTNDAAIILCIAKSQMPSRYRYPELPEQYWSFIEQCWSTHPWDRPSTEGADTAIRNEFYSLSGSH